VVVDDEVIIVDNGDVIDDKISISLSTVKETCSDEIAFLFQISSNFSS
jgi:hypothetical protein